MKRWFFLIFISSSVYGVSPIFNVHKSNAEIDMEFKNFSDNVQDIQHEVYVSTPALNDLRDGQAVIVSSNNYVRWMFRQGNEIFSVNASCVTVRR